ncbi:Gfo/Idh/MocA family oxidoreductase [Paenibacillus sp. AR247]|uniref:Gfo/Idh/MocA family oxidoreductase n=1 Tax=Paenibacillus sp. AR247 TaxID=1631599 RepID=UPI0021585F24|nr:Gfo/Idh/MocA family oxidoreductase [Paenibacillus sp. AR247]
MSKKMRFAIIGAGVIAPLHARAIVSHPEAELAAVVDAVPEKAAKIAEEFGAAHVYTDTRQMLQELPRRTWTR